MSAITNSPVLSRGASPNPNSTFTVTYTNKKAATATTTENPAAPPLLAFRKDLTQSVQQRSVNTVRKEAHKAWVSARDDEAEFASSKDEAMVLKMLVVESNNFQVCTNSTRLQQALSNRSREFKVDQVAAGVSSRVLAELIRDLDIVMGMCQNDAKCRSPFSSTKKSLSSLPLWQ